MPVPVPRQRRLPAARRTAAIAFAAALALAVSAIAWAAVARPQRLAAPGAAQLPAPLALHSSVPVPALQAVAQELNDRLATSLRAAAIARARARAARRAELVRLRRSRTVRGALRRAYLAGLLDRPDYVNDRAILDGARATAARLTGVPGAEMRNALAIIERLAATHGLTSGRIRTAFTQLRRNATWWPHRPAPAYGQSLLQGRDPVVMRYIPGRGLVVHMLGSWAKVDALAGQCGAQPKRCPRARLRRSLDRMLSFGSTRDGYLAWESLFPFAGGAPGWVSGMTQGTAIQALARGAAVLGDPRYAHAARRALGAFEQRAPRGVSVPEGNGRHYLMYSFDPHQRVLNGFLHALTGLRDLAVLDGSARAAALYRAGTRVAPAEIRAADTGAWSRYSQGGAESSLAYHDLVTGFLRDLCRRSGRRAYCDGARRFAAYERQPPRLGLAVTRRPRAGHSAALVFSLSKVSTVQVVVRGPRGPVFARRLTVPRGVHRVMWRAGAPGVYRLSADAQGPSGPIGHARTAVRVLPARHPRPRARHRGRG